VTIAKQEWLKQMEGILEILNEGVGITDDTGHVLFVNECMERLLGAPRSALIGKTAIALYSGEDYEFTLARRARIKDVGYDRYEFFIPGGDGTRVPVIISARELAIASRVQKTLAPQPLRWGRVAIETIYKPVHTIGGDFGLVFPFDGTHLDLLVCDISGHGISSALLANRIYTETVSLLRHRMELDEMLRTLNHFVIQDMEIDGFIFTMAAARLDLSGRQLVYAAAGHPPAFLISSSN
jgi:PAS domain S-box-containing protein